MSSDENMEKRTCIVPPFNNHTDNLFRKKSEEKTNKTVIRFLYFTLHFLSNFKLIENIHVTGDSINLFIRLLSNI